MTILIGKDPARALQAMRQLWRGNCSSRRVFAARRLCLLGLTPLSLGACGVSLPSPALTEHSSTDFQEVPFPPPAALPEVIPRPPRGESVWVDGEWAFRGHGYVWEHGGWIAAPRGATFAPWAFVFAEDGRLLYAPGTWYDPLGRKLLRPKPVISALTPQNTMGQK